MLANKSQSTTQLILSTKDSSVAFLQQEHAKTLKGLHGEIQKLQQKCSRLNFELTMTRGNETNLPVHSEEFNLLENELHKSQEDVGVLRSQLALQREKIVLLEHELRSMRKEMDETIKEKRELVMSTQHQIEEKSVTITQLVTKLHQTQCLLQKLQQNPSTGTELYYPPLPKGPPPDAYRTGRITRRLRRTVTSPHPMLQEPDSTSSIGDHVTLPAIPQTSLYHGNSYHSNVSLRSHSDPVKDIIHHKTKSLLPPIESEELVTNEYNKPQGSRMYRRKDLINKGLSSAPCSMRLMNYKSVHHREERSNEDSEEDGLLMIKQQDNGTMYYKLPQSHRK